MYTRGVLGFTFFTEHDCIPSGRHKESFGCSSIMQLFCQSQRHRLVWPDLLSIVPNWCHFSFVFRQKSGQLGRASLNCWKRLCSLAYGQRKRRMDISTPQGHCNDNCNFIAKLCKIMHFQWCCKYATFSLLLNTLWRMLMVTWADLVHLQKLRKISGWLCPFGPVWPIGASLMDLLHIMLLFMPDSVVHP